MVSLKGIHKTYLSGRVETPVLLGVDLSVEPGEMVAIMGPSGSGKSTLMNILGLLDRPSSGSYELYGREVSELDDDELSRLRNVRLGFVFQSFNLLPTADALENVLLPFTYADQYPPDAADKARAALARVGLEHRLDHRPGEMSGGECQRVAIARALVTDPAIILADEPTGNLDANSSREVLAILQGLNDQGHTIILVTHDPGVAGMCRRLVRLDYGRISCDQAVAEPVRALPEPGGEPCRA